MAQYGEDRVNGYPHAAGTQQNTTSQTPSMTHQITGLAQAATQPIKIGIRPLDLNNKNDRKAMNYTIQSNGRNTRNGNAVAGMRYGQNKYGIQWGSDGRVMSQTQPQGQIQTQVQSQTESQGQPITYQNKTINNGMGQLGRYRNKVGNGQTYSWDSNNNAFYTEGNNVGVGTTGLAHSGANVQLDPNTRYNFGNNRIGRKLGAAYDASTGTINTANLGRRSMRRLRNVLNQQGVNQGNVEQQPQAVQDSAEQQTNQTTGHVSGQTPGRQSILSQNFPNLFAPGFSLNNQIPIFQPNWNPNFNTQPTQEQNVVEQPTQEQSTQQTPQAKRSEVNKYTAYIDQMNGNIGKPEEEQRLNDYVTNMNNNIGVPESQQNNGFLGWLGNTISVQTIPTASSAAAFGQYMPTYQSTYGRELGTLGATLAAPFIPSAASALAGGVGGTSTGTSVGQGTVRGLIGQGSSQTARGLLGRGVTQGTTQATARPALQSGWQTGGQYASRIKNMDNWRRMFQGRTPGEIDALMRRLSDPKVWQTFQRAFGFKKGGILKAQQGASLQQNPNSALAKIMENEELATQFAQALGMSIDDLVTAAADPEMSVKLEQLAQKMMKQSAKQGAKLEYISLLRGKCPEGQELVYFAKGGRICSACKGKKLEQGGEPEYMNKFRDRQKKKQMEKCGGKMKKSK